MHERLNDWMESKGLKASVLADRIGVNRATISHILSGRNQPSIDFFKNHAILLGFVESQGKVGITFPP